MAENLPLLRVDCLSLHFDHGQTQALNQVNFQLHAGEFVALTGASGSGKSSLLNVIGLLDFATSGDIFFNNQSYAKIADHSSFRRQHFGFIFQAFHLLPTLNVLDNVLVPTLGSSKNHQAQQRAESWLAQLGLTHRLKHFPSQLSGGEKQRVAIARALINQPSVILADEPTGSLDSQNAKQVLTLLKDIFKNQSISMIMVTHDAQIAAQADRVTVMQDGKILGAAQGNL